MTDYYIRNTLTNGILQRTKGVDIVKGAAYVETARLLFNNNNENNYELE